MSNRFFTNTNSMYSHKDIYWYETCSHHHSVLQRPYSGHMVTLNFYNQLNSSHLGGSGVEGVGQVILIILIMWLVWKITLLVWE